MDKLDLKHLEDVLKLMQKYQLEEIILPDGLKLVKKIHLPTTKVVRKKKNQPDIALPSQDNTIPDSVLYVASGKPKQNGYSDMKVSSVLPNIHKDS